MHGNIMLLSNGSITCAKLKKSLNSKKSKNKTQLRNAISVARQSHSIGSTNSVPHAKKCSTAAPTAKSTTGRRSTKLNARIYRPRSDE